MGCDLGANKQHERSAAHGCTGGFVSLRINCLSSQPMRQMITNFRRFKNEISDLRIWSGKVVTRNGVTSASI